MGQHHRPQVPGQPVVAGPQPQEVQQRVEHLAAVGLRGDAVVVDVFAVILHHRFDGHAQPVRRFVERNGAVEIGEQAKLLLGVGFSRSVRDSLARPGAGCRGDCPGS